jgi:hypothetical protein
MPRCAREETAVLKILEEVTEKKSKKSMIVRRFVNFFLFLKVESDIMIPKNSCHLAFTWEYWKLNRSLIEQTKFC